MTSIYVTVPRTETKHFLKDKKEGLEKGKFIECYWDIGRQPRELKRHDEIFFIVEGWMKYWAEVKRIEGSKIWFNKIKESADPLAIKPFRGFRYFKKDMPKLKSKSGIEVNLKVKQNSCNKIV